MLSLLTKRISQGMTPAKYKLLKELTAKGEQEKCLEILHIHHEQILETKKTSLQLYEHYSVKVPHL